MCFMNHLPLTCIFVDDMRYNEHYYGILLHNLLKFNWLCRTFFFSVTTGRRCDQVRTPVYSQLQQVLAENGRCNGVNSCQAG